ncbi:Methylthioribose-1-phosphate isomerase [Erysiphe necator]|nr:Methylthioribose-1-phosphate isomerase [Erysiphe necator]
MEVLQAIIYSRGKLEVLDQLRVPHELVYEDILTCEDAFKSIVSMQVRDARLGAPAIALVAALSLSVELERKADGSTSKEDLLKYINSRLDYLFESRPTAVDLSNAIQTLKQVSHVASLNSTSNSSQDCDEIRKAYIERAEQILQDDLLTNLAIGRHGAEYLREQQLPVKKVISDEESSQYYRLSTYPDSNGETGPTYRKFSVLTHCNTGY